MKLVKAAIVVAAVSLSGCFLDPCSLACFACLSILGGGQQALAPTANAVNAHTLDNVTLPPIAKAAADGAATVKY